MTSADSFPQPSTPAAYPAPGGQHPPGSPAAPPEPGTASAAGPSIGAAPALSSTAKGGKVSALWIGLIAAAVLLIVLLVFIAQNSRRVTVRFLWLDGHMSLAIALLVSAVVGVLLVAVPGTARILQLRRAVRRAAHPGR
jgi:uncharacterized integral membrane protein